MIPNTNVALVSALDLDPIKTKLMHAASGEGWSLEHANAAEAEYRRFLYLMKTFPNEQIAPTHDVDTFWHYHILDTMKYARDCEQVFGYFLHHYPYLGLVGENGMEMLQQAGERMRELYERSFGASNARAHAQTGSEQTVWSPGPGAKAAGAETAWCFGPDAKAAGAQTTWCVGPGIVKASDVRPTRHTVADALQAS